jgi:fido (protein-threonine AMPylation protein)
LYDLIPNGNGRHARLMADLLIVQREGEPFSWSSGSLHEAGELRRRYITALQEAEATDDFIKGPPAKAVSHLD